MKSQSLEIHPLGETRNLSRKKRMLSQATQYTATHYKQF